MSREFFIQVPAQCRIILPDQQKAGADTGSGTGWMSKRE